MSIRKGKLLKTPTEWEQMPSMLPHSWETDYTAFEVRVSECPTSARSLDKLARYADSRTNSLGMFGVMGLRLEWRQTHELVDTRLKPAKKDESEYVEVPVKYVYRGETRAIIRDRRQVWTNSKGKYIKTRSHGRVFLNDDGVAVINGFYR